MQKKRDVMGHVVVLLQLGKVKYGDDLCDLPEIAEFRVRIQEHDGYNENKFKIELFFSKPKVVTVSHFFNGCVKKMVGSTRECEPDSRCIVYATIHRIHKEQGWAYTSCKTCNKRVYIVNSKKNKPTFYCEDHGNVQGVSRCKVIVRLIDQSGSSPVVFFNNIFVKLSGHKAWELMEVHGMGPDEYWMSWMLLCDAFSEELDMISHFKKDFVEEEAHDEEINDEFNTPSTMINKVKILDGSVNRVLDMQTSSTSSQVSGSGESSSSKRRRLVIDLNDLDSGAEDQDVGGHMQELVPVKLELED